MDCAWEAGINLERGDAGFVWRIESKMEYTFYATVKCDISNALANYGKCAMIEVGMILRKKLLVKLSLSVEQQIEQ